MAVFLRRDRKLWYRFSKEDRTLCKDRKLDPNRIHFCDRILSEIESEILGTQPIYTGKKSDSESNQPKIFQTENRSHVKNGVIPNSEKSEMTKKSFEHEIMVSRRGSFPFQNGCHIMLTLVNFPSEGLSLIFYSISDFVK